MNVARSCGTSCLSANPCQRSLALADLAGEAEVSKAQPGGAPFPGGAHGFRSFSSPSFILRQRGCGATVRGGTGVSSGRERSPGEQLQPAQQANRVCAALGCRSGGRGSPRARSPHSAGRRRAAAAAAGGGVALSGHCGKARCGRGLTCCGAGRAGGRAGRRPAASRAGPGRGRLPASRRRHTMVRGTGTGGSRQPGRWPSRPRRAGGSAAPWRGCSPGPAPEPPANGNVCAAGESPVPAEAGCKSGGRPERPGAGGRDGVSAAPAAPRAARRDTGRGGGLGKLFWGNKASWL